MDQEGLKRNGNQDESLAFLETGVGTAGSVLQANMHLPTSTAPLQMSQSTVASNGRVGNKKPGNLESIFDTPDIYNMENNLPGLNQGISDQERSSTNIICTSDNSVLGPLPLPDLFGPIKQEPGFSLPEGGGYNSQPGSCNLDSTNARLIEESEIWHDLDLPGNLAEIDFEFEVARLEHNILHDTANSVGGPMRGMLKETKPLIGNGGHCSNVNGTDPHHGPPILQPQPQDSPLLHHPPLHHPPPSLLSSVMIKEEKKDDYIQPGVVKQEKLDNAYCATQCLQNSSVHGGPMSSSMGHGYYRPTPSSSVSLPDQKPFAMYPTLPSVEDSWVRGRFGEGSGMQRSDNGHPAASSLAPYPANFPR